MVQSGYLVTVVEHTGPVSYRVQVSDQVWHCHTDQLLEHSVSSMLTQACPPPFPNDKNILLVRL